MFFAKLRSLRRSLAFRLTLAYTLLFTFTFLAAQITILVMMRRDIAERIDEELIEEIHEVEAIVGSRTLEEAREDLAREAEFDGVEEFFIRIYDGSGRLAFASNLFFWRGLETVAPPPAALGEIRLRTETLRDGGREVRVADGPIQNGMYTVQLGLSTEEGKRLLGNMREVVTATMLVVTLAGAFVSWWVARSSLRGIRMATRTAELISAGDLSRRVPLTGRGDEIDQLAKTFNEMVERMAVVLSSMREITDNIAHDLRSPIARIRGRAELALTRSAGDNPETDTLAADTLEECDRLLTLINTTLDISELETGVAGIGDEVIDLAELVLDTGELFEPAAEAARIDLEISAPVGVSVRGELSGLQRALANIVDNALKYTPEGGKVSIVLESDGSSPEIRVTDNGPGIAKADRKKIFERFYRGDASRSEQGNGLGLSLARALIEAHGGRIKVADAVGGGSIFILRIPVDRNGSALPPKLIKM